MSRRGDTDRAHARGFTMLELVLATVIGALVAAAATAVMYTAQRADRTYDQVAHATLEIETTRLVVSRAWDQVVTARGTPPQTEEGEAPATDLPRARILLEPDDTLPDAGGDVAPQRLELALAQEPISLRMATTLAGSAFSEDDAASRNFIDAEGVGGAMRGVFEWRPDGTRERVMDSLGLRRPLEATPPPRSDERTGWSLWFRRMPSWEVERLHLGLPALADGEWANVEDERDRLAGAVRLLSGVADGRWNIFQGYERVLTFASTYTVELPVYVELEFTLLTGRRESWMFEISWTEGADPVPDAAQPPSELLAGDADAGQRAETETESGAAADGDTAAGGSSDTETGSGSGRRPSRQGTTERYDTRSRERGRP